MLQASLQHEAQEGVNTKAELLHKWDMITSFSSRDAAMDAVIKLLSKENMLNKQRWEAARTNTQQFVKEQLLPATTQVCKEVTAMHEWMAREQAAFAQVALHQLPTSCAAGDVYVHAFITSACKMTCQHIFASNDMTSASSCVCQVAVVMHMTCVTCNTLQKDGNQK